MAGNVVSTEYVHRFLVMLLICDTELLWADFPEFHWNYPTCVWDDSLPQVWRLQVSLDRQTNKQTYRNWRHISTNLCENDLCFCQDEFVLIKSALFLQASKEAVTWYLSTLFCVYFLTWSFWLDIYFPTGLDVTS